MDIETLNNENENEVNIEIEDEILEYEVMEDDEAQSMEEDEDDDDEDVSNTQFKEGDLVNLNGELIDPLKKKRGRKPKQKTEEPVLKKRGRKPKIKEEIDEEDKVPKKRGRKPKEKTYSVIEEVVQDSATIIDKTETVILHLPIRQDMSDVTEPSPYLKRNINYSMISSTYSVLENVDMGQVRMVPKREKMENGDIQRPVEMEINPVVTFGGDDSESDIMVENNQFENIDKNKRNNIVMNIQEETSMNQIYDTEQIRKNDYDIHYSFLENTEYEEENMIQEIEVKKDREVENTTVFPSQTNMVSLSDDTRVVDNMDVIGKIVKKNVKNILYEFVNSNAANTWPESTNTCCWWCCHTFEGMPCALPELYRKDKFYVSGVYCSFQCAAAYNFSKNDGEDMWMRYSLLNLMYKKMFGLRFVKIGLAPPREVLKMFGGYMCIDEFREGSLRMDKIYHILKPPLVAIIPKIEENIIHKGIRSGNVNEHILNKTQNNLKLKRTKPLVNPNSTLQSFMNIKIVEK